MTTFPSPLYTRLQTTLAQCKRRVENAHQRLNTIGSQVNSLQPGDWNLLELNSGWSSTSGYIPAQTRLQQTGVAWLIGHIEGGEVASGTVIGTLAPGFYNEVHSHSFTANVVSGAGATATAGAISGSTDSNALSDGGVSGPTTSNALSNGGTQGTSAAASGSGSHSHGAGSYSVTNSYHTHSAGGMAVNNSFHQHTNSSGGQVPTTPINYNTAILTIDPSGNLTLSNCPAEATAISFSEHLPLITS